RLPRDAARVAAKREVGTMDAGQLTELIHFHSDLYRRDALQSAAEKFRSKARIELAESNGRIAVRLEPVGAMSDGQVRELGGEFCTEALSLTVRQLREAGVPDDPAPVASTSDEPPWELLAPFRTGSP